MENIPKNGLTSGAEKLGNRTSTKLTEREIHFCLENLPSSWSALPQDLKDEIEVLRKKLFQMKEELN